MTATDIAPMTPSPARHRAPSTTDDAGPPPRWHRYSLVALLLGTAVLYLWNLTESGYGNDFYAAAVQAGTQDWKAWLFGSLDAGNGITVDKPPAALWVGVAFARIFGFSSWTVLAPQAFMGVGAVWLTYATVRRTSGSGAGLLAGAAFALTPVAALMFRFNLPDALLVLLLVAGAYCVVRAAEVASGRWLALAGAAVGFAFLTKMLQAFLVLPAFALVYLVVAPTSVRRRILHVLGAGLAMIVSAGWYVALVQLWPASSRPYIGGSENNSFLDLVLGYNGFGRIFGGSGNGGGGGGSQNTAFGGSTGIGRLFGESMGTEISWLLPAALIGLVAGLWFTRRTPRTEKTRAALLLWGGWVLVTGVVFSFMQGTIHPYYTVALAPAIAALVAISGRELWRGRANVAARGALAAMIAATAVWAYVLLARSSDFVPVLRWIVLAAGILVATAVAMGVHQFRRMAAVLAISAVLLSGAGSASYALATAGQAHSGSIPTSGPASTSGFGGGRGGPGGTGGMGTPTGGTSSTGASGTNSGTVANGQSTSEALTALLSRSTARWAAATTGSQSAASLEISSGASVLAIGGWSGSDPSPTLAQFTSYVASGQIDYYIVGGMGGGRGGPGGSQGSSSQISAWVAAHYPARTIGGQTVYDLSS